MKGARPGDRLRVIDLILMVAGAALGLWLVTWIRGTTTPGLSERFTVLVVFLLGGISLAGPVILLARVRRGRRRSGPGELIWFVEGTAAWLLWPPIVVRATRTNPPGESMATICYFYGTPLMALFMAIGLLSGGWLGRGRGRRRSGRELFGLLLGLAWACTGLYLLSVIYRNDLR